MNKENNINYIVKWLTRKWKGKKTCPICQKNNWDISDKIFQNFEIEKNVVKLGGISYPTIPITCGSCGYVLFFNPIVLGLIDDNKKNSDNSEITSDMIDTS